MRASSDIRSGLNVKEVDVVVTRRVREEVRKHFGCDKLSGAELEDQGEEGTALTHWEKRLFENEAMTGTHTQNPIYSRITMALMEDTGWYLPNYDMAEELKWGKNLGCDFALKSCKDWMESRKAAGKSIHPYCNKVKRDPLETECTEDRSSVALCNLVHHGHLLPPPFQNFDSIPHVSSPEVGYYGGSVALADYCPYIQVRSVSPFSRKIVNSVVLSRSSPGAATTWWCGAVTAPTLRTSPVSKTERHNSTYF